MSLVQRGRVVAGHLAWQLQQHHLRDKHTVLGLAPARGVLPEAVHDQGVDRHTDVALA